MKLEAYNEWINMYNEGVEVIWTNERPELRKVAIVMSVLKNEFKNVQESINSQYNYIRDELDKLDKQKSLSSSVSGETISSDDLTTLSPNTPDKLEEIIESSPPLNTKTRFGKSKRTKPRKLFVKKNTKVTSVQVEDEGDSTIIGSTPDEKNLKFVSFKRKSYKKPSLQCTLTQMFTDEKENSNADDKFTNKKENEHTKGVSTRKPTTYADIEPRDGEKSTVCEDGFVSLIDISNSMESEQNLLDSNICARENKCKEIIRKEPVVRGKKRQLLHGWDCEECEKFYNEMGENSRDAKQLMDKCSKHRASRKPELDDTPLDYWTFAFPPTQKAPKKKDN